MVRLPRASRSSARPARRRGPVFPHPKCAERPRSVACRGTWQRRPRWFWPSRRLRRRRPRTCVEIKFRAPHHRREAVTASARFWAIDSPHQIDSKLLFCPAEGSPSRFDEKPRDAVYGMPVSRISPVLWAFRSSKNSTSDTPTSPRGWPRSWCARQE